MNQAINALKSAAGYVAKVYKPRGAVVDDLRSVASSFSKAQGVTNTAKLHAISKDAWMGQARGIMDYLGAGDFRGQGNEVKRLGVAAARIGGSAAALQGAGRLLGGGSPVMDEYGMDAPGLPWI